MEQLRYEFQRLRNNAARKREMLLIAAQQHTRRQKRLAIIAGILALLSAATVTSVLSDYTPARAMKIIAALLSTASGLISLFSNLGFKDSELHDLYTGAGRYLSLRERAHRISFNPDIDEHQKFKMLEELQDLYLELDEKYQRYLVATATHPSRIFSQAVSRDFDDYSISQSKPLTLGSQAADYVDEHESDEPEDNPEDYAFGRRKPIPENDDSKMA